MNVHLPRGKRIKAKDLLIKEKPQAMVHDQGRESVDDLVREIEERFRRAREEKRRA